jgi:uncharacterized protein
MYRYLERDMADTLTVEWHARERMVTRSVHDRSSGRGVYLLATRRCATMFEAGGRDGAGSASPARSPGERQGRSGLMTVGSAAPIRRDEVIRALAERREELAREHRVRSLSLFGSVAWDEAGPNSDVDVLVDFHPGATLFTMGGLQQYLEELFGRGVDLVSRGAIKRQIRERVLGEEVPVLDTAPDGSLAVVVREDHQIRSDGQSGRGAAMAERNWKMWVEDILEAIEDIRQFTQGMDFDTFFADRRTTLAVNHSFAIIGEAERRIPPEVEARYPAIPWANMRRMRNVLIHNYPDVNLTVVWETARDDLPPLVPMLREILEREP